MDGISGIRMPRQAGLSSISSTSQAMPGAAPAVSPAFGAAAPSLGTVGRQFLVWMLDRFEKSDHTYSHTLFLQNSMINLVPKLPVIRSPIELLEVLYTEFTESWAFYYASPVFGGLAARALVKAGSRLFGSEAFQKSYEAVLKHPQANKLMAAKAATIITGIGAALSIGFTFNYFKNLITQQLFNKATFSNIIQLSDKDEGDAANAPAIVKSRRRIKQVFGTYSVALAGAAGLAAFGHKFKPLQAFSELLVRRFDFDFAKNVFGLTTAQVFLVSTINDLSYLDAARDKLEGKEIATRLMWTSPMTSVGNHLLSLLTLNWLSKRMPSVMDTLGKRDARGTLHDILSLREVAAYARDTATNTLQQGLGRAPSAAEVTARASELARPMVNAKLVAKFAPLVVAITSTWAYLVLVHRVLTPWRFKNQQAEKAQQQQQEAMRQMLGVQRPQQPAISAMPLPSLATQQLPPAYTPRVPAVQALGLRGHINPVVIGAFQPLAGMQQQGFAGSLAPVDFVSVNAGTFS